MIAEWGDGQNYMIADRIHARIKVRLERTGDGPWRKCITTTVKETQMIPDEAVEAAAEALVGSTLGDRAGINWEEFFEAARAALEAAAPSLMAQAFDEGQKSGMRHADRLRAAAKIGRPELPGPLSPNPYQRDTK